MQTAKETLKQVSFGVKEVNMAEVIKGADVRGRLAENIRAKLKEIDAAPRLALIRIGEDPSDISYEKGIIKTCSGIGIETAVNTFPEGISQPELEDGFKKINEDPAVNGILLFRPLPKGLDDKPLSEMIDPEKDMDCMSPLNWGKLAMGDTDGYYPCTAEAIMKILSFAGVDLKGKSAVIFGVSPVVGRPLGLMLTARGASVTWIRSTTKDVEIKCKNADILVGCCGVAGRIGKEIACQASPSCIAIDAGINFKDGKMCGDFVFDEAEPYVSKITPVPGGVGAVTNTILAGHVARAAIKANTGEIFDL